MSVLRDRPYVNGNFIVDFGIGDDDSVTAGFAEVILPASSAEVVEYRNGNEKENVPRKMPGGVQHERVILKRGLIGDLSLYEWWTQVENGDLSAYRDVTITLQSEDRTAAVFTWTLRNAWPAAYRFSPLHAGGEEIVMEIIELAYERLFIE
jgi:phage tail-like protein